MRNLVAVEVQGLLGRFDHRVDFPASWDFAILHGPNGVGKTKLLQLMTAAMSLNTASLRRIPFRSASFDFDDNHRLSLIRVDSDGYVDTIASGDESVVGSKIKYSLETPSGRAVSWVGEEMTTDHWIRARRFIEREAPIRRLPNGLWRDARVGDTVTYQELMERYIHALPSSILHEFGTVDAPEELRRFCESVNVHLIETQRLTTRDSAEDARRPDRDSAAKPTVVQYAEDLRRQLQSALASNSRTTQQLDRTFPKRVLEAKVSPAVDDDAIRARYGQQSELRARLSQIALLEDRTDLPLPRRKLQDWERRVLWTYLDDTDQKLETFEPLLRRCDALRDIIGDRFLYKRLVIDAEVGFRIETDEGGPVPATSLSSGEQHELILVYDLLFNAPSNSLVLIDEPEISLHVAWQQRFLADVAKISEIASLRFVVATHSPQIIHKWWARTVRLAPGQFDEIDERDGDGS